MERLLALLAEIGYPEPSMVRDGGMPYLIADPKRAKVDRARAPGFISEWICTGV